MGYDLKGDGVAVYDCIIKTDENPKVVEKFSKVFGSESTGGNGSELPNRKLIIRTTKNEILDYIELQGAVLSPEADIDPQLLIRD